MNTLKFANRLKSAGMDDRLAEELADALNAEQESLDEHVATKADMKEVKLLIAGLYLAGTAGAAWMAWLSAKVVAIAEKIL